MLKKISWISLCCPFMLNAQVNIGSLQDAFRVALENNPDYQVAQLEYTAAGWDYIGSYTAVTPQVNLSAVLNHNYALQTQLIPAVIFGGNPGDYVPVKFGTAYNSQAVIDISQPLINAEGWKSIEIAAKNKALSQAGIDNAELQLKTKVMLDFYAVLLSGIQAESGELLLRYQDSLLLVTAEKYNQGLVDPVEYQRLQVTRNNVEIQSRQFALDYKTKMFELKQTLGMKATDSLNFTAALDTNTFMATLSAPVASPLLSSLMLQERIFKAQADQKFLQWVPTLSFQFRYAGQSQRNDLNNVFNQPWQNFGYVGLSMNLPLLRGTGTISEIGKAKAQWKIAGLRLEAAKLSENTENQQLISEYSATTQTATTAKDNYNLSYNNLVLTMEKFNEGIISTESAINITNEFINSRTLWLGELYKQLVYGNTLEIKKSYNP